MASLFRTQQGLVGAIQREHRHARALKSRGEERIRSVFRLDDNCRVRIEKPQ
jgi:hypothetical protein